MRILLSALGSLRCMTVFVRLPTVFAKMYDDAASTIPRATSRSILKSVQGRSFNCHCPAELLALTSLLTHAF